MVILLTHLLSSPDRTGATDGTTLATESSTTVDQPTVAK